MDRLCFPVFSSVLGSVMAVPDSNETSRKILELFHSCTEENILITGFTDREMEDKGSLT